MGLRSFASGLSLCAVLLASGGVLARDQTSADVQNWFSAVITKIANAGGAIANPPERKTSPIITMRVQIRADGSVNWAEGEKSSGSPDLDERARSLVRAASPFSPPPATLLTKDGETELSFPLQLGP